MNALQARTTARCLALLLGAAVMMLASGPAKAAQLTIVAFGDSWTMGRYVDIREAYPAQLEAALKAKGYDVAVQNAGVNGDRTDNALARVDAAAPPGTKIALVEFGLNDARHEGRLPPVDPAVTKANLDTLVRGLQARGVQVLLIGAKDLDYSDVAAHDGAAYEQWPALDPRDTAGGHPTAAGYKLIVAHMLPAVEQLIARVNAAH